LLPGLLWLREFTIPGKGSYDKSYIAVNSHSFFASPSNSQRLTPSHKRVKVFLGATNRPVCPVAGIVPYSAAHGGCQGPLFVTDEGSGLTL